MYYHGTAKDIADIIVESQQMKSSVGDDQWLGDGYYFYCDAEYAFRWILIKYTNNFRNEFASDYSNIYDKYSIISAEINISPERLFSMDNIHHRLLFIETKNEINKKLEKSKKYRGSVVDGVVFNFLFQKLNYGDQFDAVKAVFPISYIFDNSRMDFLPEPQICVKNEKVISNYKKCSSEKVPEEFEKFIVRYNKIKYDLMQKRTDYSKYKRAPKCIKYKKEELTGYDGN